MLPAVLGEMIPMCSQADLRRLQSLKSMGVGGARTSEDVFQWAASQGIPYFDCSGATEAVGTICVRLAGDIEQRTRGLQVISGLMGVLEKANPDDDFGELIIHGTVNLLLFLEFRALMAVLQHLPTGYEGQCSEAFSYDTDTGVTTYRTGDLYRQEKAHSGQTVPTYSPSRQGLSGKHKTSHCYRPAVNISC